MGRLNEFKQREADSYSRRRKLMGREQRREFDSYYGKQKAGGGMGVDRRRHAAGKGDARRPGPTDERGKLMMDIGWELSFNHDLTESERDELRAMWDRLKNGETNDT